MTIHKYILIYNNIELCGGAHTSLSLLSNQWAVTMKTNRILEYRLQGGVMCTIIQRSMSTWPAIIWKQINNVERAHHNKKGSHELQYPVPLSSGRCLPGVTDRAHLDSSHLYFRFTSRSISTSSPLQTTSPYTFLPLCLVLQQNIYKRKYSSS